VLPTFRRHINTYYRLFELVNEAAAVALAATAACDLLLFGQVFPLRFLLCVVSHSISMCMCVCVGWKIDFFLLSKRKKKGQKQ